MYTMGVRLTTSERDAFTHWVMSDTGRTLAAREYWLVRDEAWQSRIIERVVNRNLVLTEDFVILNTVSPITRTLVEKYKAARR